jgi:hypothetical protein
MKHFLHRILYIHGLQLFMNIFYFLWDKNFL